MKLKRSAALLLAIIMTFFISASPALAAGQKNETVYAMLKYDGSVDTIYVVNQLTGEYTDYGEYTDIKNLSTLSKPEINGDKIVFPDEQVEGGLYYQGTVRGELPMIVQIKYYLDGERIDSANLAGAKGRLRIEISCGVNDKCDERVRDGYMAQISLPLDLNCVQNVTAPDSTSVAAGKTLNLSFIVLPGKNEEFYLEADVDGFETDGMTITLLKGTIYDIEETINETEDGFDDMLGGAEDMVDGTSDLKDGISSLVRGMGSLSGGMSTLASSGDDILSGIQDYKDGLKEYTDGVEGIAAGSSGIREGLDTLSENAAAISGGVADISSNLGALSASSADLKALAESLLSSGDPDVQMLAQGTLNTLGALSQLSAGLAEASSGVDGFAGGVKQTAQQYHDFDEGLAALSENGGQLSEGYGEMEAGLDEYLAGVKSSAGGMKKLYSAIKGLPKNIQELLDGQIEFRDGIASARDDIVSQTEGFVADDSPAVSFASPDKNNPESVQYILKTPKIAVSEQFGDSYTNEKNADFFTRLADLFK